MSGPRYDIMGVASGETDSQELVIAEVPEAIRSFLTLLPNTLVIGGPVIPFLQMLSEKCAGIVNRTLHHGEYIFTSDPEELQEFGWTRHNDGCDVCEEGLRTGKARLAENPDTILCVGQLHWLKEDAR